MEGVGIMKKMKNFKVLFTIVTLFSFLIISNATAGNTTGTLSISGTGVTKSGSNYVISVDPNTEFTVQLAIDTTGVVTGADIPWNYNSIKTNLSLVDLEEKTSKLSVTYTGDTDAIILNKLVCFATKNINPTNGKVLIADIKLKTSASFTDDINLVFSNGSVVDENSNENTLTGTTLTIKKAVKYTVTFNSNGGSTVASKQVLAGSAVTLPANPTKSGYTFDGWYTNSGLTTKYTNQAITQNTTLYAKWTSSSVVDPNPPVTDPGDGEEIDYDILFPNDETEDPILPKANVDTDKPTVTDTTATITFDVGDADGKCVIYRSTSKDSGYVEIKTIDCKGKTTFTDSGLNPDTTYYYRIRMVGSKKISDAIIVKTLTSSSGGSSEAAKDKNVKGDTVTGAFTPIAIIMVLTGAFILLRKYYKDNSFFSRI